MLDIGILQKMYIQCFADDKPETTANVVDGSDRFTLLINPETISRKYAIEYSDGHLPNTNQQPKYFATKPEEFKLDILFDSTGVVVNAGILPGAVASLLDDSATDVSGKIKTLKKFLYVYDGQSHKPPYVKVFWGSDDGFFKGILTGLDIDYKLFRTDGKPIRAVAHVSLISTVHPETAVKLEDNQSPDITHVRIFKAGDRFTKQVEKIYDDPNFYTDVARANKMVSFRKINIGDSIQYPPTK